MPDKLVPVLHVTDARKSTEWYARLGFTLESEHQFAQNMPIYAFLKRGDNSLHLSEHKGDAKPDTLVYFYVDDVDSLAQEFGETAKEQPWGMREIWITDPDGNRWRIGASAENKEGDE
ncbi:MAG: VOC family protein [Planctomycetales bacterium]|nr:VOC family protein [Planctomycetales bacterium]